MAGRHDDADGSDIFWPGYVDATTNLILNLLFLLTILIVAVFMFALELGRSTKAVSDKPPVEQTVSVQGKYAEVTPETVEENVTLKKEIERLNKLLAQRVPAKGEPSGLRKTIEATSPVVKPQTGLDKTLARDLEIDVRFKDGAVALTSVEHDQLMETLKPIVAHGKTRILVEVPAGFSEAKRMGFYRAMAVRNILLEMKLPKENINVSVSEVNKDANAALVRVRSE